MAKKPLIVDFDDAFEMEQAFINAAGTGKVSLISSTVNNIVDLPIELIDFSEHQPRIITDKVLQEIEILATSITANGQIYPIVVIQREDRYELVGGEKRFRAVRDVLKNKTIRAIIRDNTSTEKTALISLIDNLHRSNLSDFELINAIQKHCDEFGHSIQDIEFITHKYQIDQSKYFRLMSFYKIPNYIKEDLKINPKAISGATAQQLLTELNKLVLKFNHKLVESSTFNIWKKYLNEFIETNRPSKKFIYEIEKALNLQNTATKQEQNIVNTSKVNKTVLKNKDGLKFGSIKVEKNLNGKTVVNIRTSLNSEFDQEKIERVEAFLAELDHNG
ncbi:ParB/RepB/Spo0J family partition protein [Acinetobacter harbinensis]|mgnify:CR=1 FL=1|uniref:ParB/RepB/Spo0J family partition protein n=1 Tax=Acinetobacter harbinensis TaxID=1353941 RepID=UPI001C4EBEA2|nr:ParB/RepB/Spo0J family partition protein [Acinetobacter harbinensis]